MNNITIRIMTLADYEVIHALWSKTPGVGQNPVNDSKEGIEKYLVRNPSTCFVAEKNGAIAGAILGGHDGRRGTICRLAVDEQEKRQGIGGALVKAALAALHDEGINKVWLVAFADNAQGNAFWEKRGFGRRDDLNYYDIVLLPDE